MTSFAPPLPPLPVTTSPVRSLWLRDNSVEPGRDPRGTGLATATPEVLVEHVRARRITEVFLAAHGAGDGGAVDAWTSRTCRVLRGRRTYVAALGGAVDWLRTESLGADGVLAGGAGSQAYGAPAGGAASQAHGAPAGGSGRREDSAPPGPDSAASRWTRAALGLGPFHRVHLDLAPWRHPAWQEERAAVWSSYLTALAEVRDAADGLPLDVDVPWWFATMPDDDGVPLLGSVLSRVSRVVVLIEANRAEGPDGVLKRLRPSARLCEASRTGFSVGVDVGESAGGGVGAGGVGAGGVGVGQRDPIERRGEDGSGPGDCTAGSSPRGSRRFGDLSALDREAAVVRAHMRDSTVYRSFAASDYRSWVPLLEPHESSPGAIPA